MSKRSPAPWESEMFEDEDGAVGWHIRDARGAVVAIVGGREDVPVVTASPDLLAACEAAHTSLRNAACYCAPHQPCSACDALEKVEQAIAKAKGGTA